MQSITNSDTAIQIPPFWTKLNDIWRYPMQSAPLLVIAIGAFLALVVAYLPMFGLLRAFLDLAVIAYVYKYGAEVLLYTARGNVDEAPEYATSVQDDQGWQQIYLFTGMYVLAIIAAALLPVIFAVPVVLVLVLGYPAASIMVAVEGSALGALNPLRWFEAMGRIGWPYLAVVLLSICFVISKFYLTDLVTFLWTPLAVLLTNAVSFYFSVMSFYLLGYLVCQYHEALGFELAPKPKELARTHAHFDPEQGAIDECEALVVQGNLTEAAARFRSLINSRGATPVVHARYRKILKLIPDNAGLIEHGTNWLSVLIAQEKPAQAAALYKECLALDATFLPRMPEEFAGLAVGLSDTDPKLAISLLQNFYKKFPKSKLAPSNLLLAAKILANQMRDLPAAQKLVAQLQTRFADSPQLSAINDYAEVLAKRQKPAA
jgi:hypothetical protein